MGCTSVPTVVTSANGTFSDCSGSTNYENDAKCRLVIAPTGAQQVTLDFTSFKTELSKDFLRVYSCFDADCGSTQTLQELSGAVMVSATPSITSTTGFMLVEFTSDNSGTDEGFTATWKSVELPSVAYILLFYPSQGVL
jgi:hypothetical protein